MWFDCMNQDFYMYSSSSEGAAIYVKLLEKGVAIIMKMNSNKHHKTLNEGENLSEKSL